MKLIELNPKYGSSDGVQDHIIFDCPKCKAHKISIPIPPATGCVWQKTGDSFENITLSPSIWHNKGGSCPGICDIHFWIRNGEIIIC